jgi:hypothetical protein
LGLQLLALSAAQARAQDGAPCAHPHSEFGPLICPNGASCGKYTTIQVDKCNRSNACENAYPIQICSLNKCKPLDTYEDSAVCLIAEMNEGAEGQISYSRTCQEQRCSGSDLSWRLPPGPRGNDNESFKVLRTVRDLLFVLSAVTCSFRQCLPQRTIAADLRMARPHPSQFERPTVNFFTIAP